MLKLRSEEGGSGDCQTQGRGSWVRRVMFQEVRGLCHDWSAEVGTPSLLGLGKTLRITVE